MLQHGIRIDCPRLGAETATDRVGWVSIEMAMAMARTRARARACWPGPAAHSGILLDTITFLASLSATEPSSPTTATTWGEGSH